MNRQALVSMLVGGALWIGALGADAYRPSARWALRNAMTLQIKRNVNTISAHYDVKFFTDGGATPLTTKETLHMVAPDKIRRELQSSKGPTTTILNGSKGVMTSADGKRDNGVKPTLWDVWLTSGAPLDASALGKRLQSASTAYGIDLDTVSYGRFDGQINYIIGAKSTEREKPQLWVDKATFRITRLIWRPRKDAPWDEWRYLGWAGRTGTILPTSIERRLNGKLVERHQLVDSAKNGAVDRALFKQ